MDVYQSDKNSIWYTEDEIFCSISKKQISVGFEVADSNKIIVGMFSEKIFFSDFLNKIFNKNEFIFIRKIISNANPTKIYIKSERGKINYRIRYEVLKRDGFKCVSCGAIASDCNLEVDHICPVSKGGKTISSNLQSLCSKCNKGKSNVH